MSRRSFPRSLSGLDGRLVALCVLLAACGGGGGVSNTPTTPTPPTPVLTTVVVSLSAATIQVGQTMTASATGLDQNGASIAVGTIAWSSGSPLVATVTASGVVSAVAAGQAQIIATSGSKQGQQAMTVIPVPVASVTVAPPTATVAIGATQQLTASTLDALGNVLTGRVITWTSSDSTRATVSATGLATAVAAGTATITATSEGKSGSSAITVPAPPVATVTVAPTAATLSVGATQQLTATMRDAGGNILTGKVVAWTSSDLTRATVSSSGLVTAVGAGSATITATSEGKSATATLTVTAVPVATVTVTPATASVAVGATQAVTATAFDAGGNVLSGKVVTWASSNPAVVGVTANGNAATLTGASAGSATVTATSEGKSGTSLITVTTAAQACSSGTALQLTVGEIRTLTAAQVASLCLGGSASASEYVLIPFSHTATAAATLQLEVTGTNTSTVLASPLAGQAAQLNLRVATERARLLAAGESALRERERRELAPVYERFRAARLSAALGVSPSPGALVSNPTVGQVLTLNSNGNQGCSNPIFKSARIVAVSQRAIVMVETTAPTGGYTDAELAAFGTAFDSQVYPLDVANFGAPTDIDGNGRIGVFFTTGVNVLTTNPSQGVVGGFFFSRDLFPVAQCPGSNSGEMFYMPVPDPNSTINGSYKTKSQLSQQVTGTLAHEFQHLINSGRRLFINTGATSTEEVWLNEGLSHIAEELLYYQQAGSAPRSNLGLSNVAPNQAQLDIFNAYANGDFGLLISYLLATSVNSPYAQNGALETRGAIWQLLRYSADRLGGTESSIWFSLVNSLTAGQANFNAVFGDIVALTRDWAIAQFTDDASLGVSSIYTNPSWNFRSILPAYFNPQHHPLVTVPLVSGTPSTFSLAGGGAAYVRFRVVASVLATVASTSGGAPVPAGVDFILVRTQ